MTKDEVMKIYTNISAGNYEARAILTLAMVIAEIFGQNSQEKTK